MFIISNCSLYLRFPIANFRISQTRAKSFLLLWWTSSLSSESNIISGKKEFAYLLHCVHFSWFAQRIKDRFAIKMRIKRFFDPPLIRMEELRQTHRWGNPPNRQSINLISRSTLGCPCSSVHFVARFSSDLCGFLFWFFFSFFFREWGISFRKKNVSLFCCSKN